MLWLHGGSAQPLKLTPNNTKETLESLWQEKSSQSGQCYSLNLRPKLTLSTCSLSPLMPVLKFLTVPDQLCISLQHPHGTLLNSAMWTPHTPMHNTENSRPSVVTLNPPIPDSPVSLPLWTIKITCFLLWSSDADCFCALISSFCQLTTML